STPWTRRASTRMRPPTRLPGTSDITVISNGRPRRFEMGGALYTAGSRLADISIYARRPGPAAVPPVVGIRGRIRPMEGVCCHDFSACSFPGALPGCRVRPPGLGTLRPRLAAGSGDRHAASADTPARPFGDRRQRRVLRPGPGSATERRLVEEWREP